MTDAATAASANTAAPPPPSGSAASHFWKDGDFGFRDILDTINPLQHLPVIGAIYRWATGDEPGDAARIAGDTLYGGPIGFVAGLAAAITKDDQGHDLGEQAITALLGPAGGDASPEAPGETQVAAATPINRGCDDPSWLATIPGPATPNVPPLPAATIAALYGTDPSIAGLRPSITTDAPATTAVAAATTPAASSSADKPPARPAAAPASADTKAAPATETAAATATAPVVPDHPPMPLFAKPASAGTPEQSFLTRNAAFQRQYNAPGRAGAPSSRPVPLELTAGTLPPRPMAATRPAQPASAGLPQNAPVDISQKMLDALDKYMKLEQQQRAKQASGTNTDVVVQ